jgi:hypothetical protein
MGEIDTFDFTPDPISLLESNRNLGYSIEEAIADLIDNSISAGSTKISFELHWNDGTPYFLLTDNGCGMSNKDNELVNSFRLGSTNPLETRGPADLGRFGFGMKTASLSQARILTVITKKKGDTVQGLSLDLKFIGEQNGKWLLKRADANLCKREFDVLNQMEAGTIIRWDVWDRAPKVEEDFMAMITMINTYIGVCFHRFIENGLSIKHHENPISAFSPIPQGEGAEKTSSVALKVNKMATLGSYILQHPRNWSEDYENISRFNSFRLFDGFESQQGIYIYRCNRLLTPKGGWLGLLKKSNATKLARVVIDYPNDADELWSLDITKTNASIPFEFKNEIEKFVKISKNGSVSKIVRGHRNINRELSTNHSHIWQTINDKDINSYRYKIDEEHPVIINFVEDNNINKKDIKNLLKLISDNLPVAKIIDNNDSDPSKHDRMWSQKELSEADLKIAKILFQNQMKIDTKIVAFSWLLNFEPFCYFERQLRQELL